MATLKFILRKSSRVGSHTGKVCARLIHQRQVRICTLDVSLYPHEWDERARKIILCEEGTLRYRQLRQAEEVLENYAALFEEAVALLEEQGRYSVYDIVTGYQGRRSMLTLEGFTGYLFHRLERSGQERTARAYGSACRALVKFNKGRDIPLKHINGCLIKEFESELKEQGKAMNTISYYMRMLRAIYRRAIKEQLIDGGRDNPFEGVFTGFQETQKRALDLDQLRKLNSLDFSKLLEEPDTDLSSTDKELYDCWRYFFFCFHARGMSYVDMAYLRKENIKGGVISYYRKKTGKKIEVTLSPILRRIIDSFSKENGYNTYLFPVIRSKDKPVRRQYENGLSLQNKRLKKLAARAGIAPGFGLTTHVTRHSWATTGKRQNLPLSVISEGLGHRSEKTTHTYLASFERSTLDLASKKIDLAVIGPWNGKTGNNYPYAKL